MYLVTGYEPFDDHERNPSATLAETFDGRRVGGTAVVGRVLPVVFGEAESEMESLLDEYDPDAVVMTGLAPERTAVCLERVAINVDDTITVPDNAENEPEAQPIDEGGPDARFATLPVGECVESLLEDGIPARLSNTAGTHLCNHLTYVTLGLLEGRAGEQSRAGGDGGDAGAGGDDGDADAGGDGGDDDAGSPAPVDVPAGFVHLPYTPKMAASKAAAGNAHRGGEVPPSLPLETQRRALEVVLETISE